MRFISAQQVDQVLDFPTLIDALQRGFAADFQMPPRQLYTLDTRKNAFALLPAWTDNSIAVKAFCYFPDNSAATPAVPILHSNILLYRRKDGQPLAMVEGSSVTCWRTAAVSALAARYLARRDSQHLLLLGTGALALPLLRAHLSEHPLRHISIWGRNLSKAAQLRERLQRLYPALLVDVCQDLPVTCERADIIVAATGASAPLLHGADIKPGCFVSLLGNHSPAQRECDSALVCRAAVYVDDRQNVLNEAGELLIPISEGVFSAEQIHSDLAGLCRHNQNVRASQNTGDSPAQITLFKSVGTALADLLCAELVLQQPYFG
ncbi:MAG: ornithine cyclodeaminase family protein [Rheinheimera sp.]|nr:MAG: ornithine cyclodeaminase family protein [Rheinheimera sp.]